MLKQAGPTLVTAPREGCGGGAGCGISLAQGEPLPEALRRRIENHPCYSEEAHHYFARMHLAVAPACNIQCHYCNRKYDCANESRPGVVSELLTPEQAVQKTLAVAAAIPELAVVGIAGPGDPLANPARTFATFRALSAQAPDLKLCVSTNGLALPEHVEELVKHNIGHVTITINCLDPDIGAKIYPWIFWDHRRIGGRRAAEILIAQQLKGLEMLVAKDVLVKINSVMIPGVNDEHLQELNRVVKQKGAFLHNIMPLLARPEHGTYYGLTGQREPDFQELHALREACGAQLKTMRHCRQCRSDAVGLLGQNRSEEFSLNKVRRLRIDPQAAMAKRAETHEAIRQRLAERQGKIAAPATLPSRQSSAPAPRAVLMAVASKGGGLIDEHFGQAHEFLLYEVTTASARLLGRRQTDLYCTGPANCGDAESNLNGIIRALAGCELLLCARIGYTPWQKLESAGIQPNGEHALEPIEDALTAVYRELLAAGKLDKTLGVRQTSA